MNKRLRKKKRIGEFQQLGFAVGFRFSGDLDTESRNALTDRFIEEAIENNNLQFGGGGFDPEWNGIVEAEGARGSTTNEHRELVKQWFIQEPDIFEYYVSNFIDAWYADYEESESEWVEKNL